MANSGVPTNDTSPGGNIPTEVLPVHTRLTLSTTLASPSLSVRAQSRTTCPALPLTQEPGSEKPVKLAQLSSGAGLVPRLNRENAMPLKYVMLKLDGGEFLPLLFPEFIQHSDMARSVPATVVSAGHVYLKDGMIVASGASSSLEVASRDEDSEIIQSYLNEQSVIQQERPSGT